MTSESPKIKTTVAARAKQTFLDEKTARDAEKAQSQQRNAVRSEKERKSRVTTAKKWAVPILNNRFGPDDWDFKDAAGGIATFTIPTRLGAKELTVTKDGLVSGTFHVRVATRYGQTQPYEKVIVRSLEHLGELLVSEEKNWDEEMCRGD